MCKHAYFGTSDLPIQRSWLIGEPFVVEIKARGHAGMAEAASRRRNAEIRPEIQSGVPCDKHHQEK